MFYAKYLSMILTISANKPNLAKAKRKSQTWIIRLRRLCILFFWRKAMFKKTHILRTLFSLGKEAITIYLAVTN